MTSAPDIDEILDLLQKHIWMGRTHLRLWRQVNNYLAGRPDILNVSGTFFAFTLRSHLDSAFLHLARLVDTHREAISVPYLLRVAETHAATFAHGSQALVNECVVDDRVALARLSKSIDAVVVRRDKQLAHLDKATVRKAGSIEADAAMSYKEADDLFVALSMIVNHFSGLWRDSSTAPELLEWDDFVDLADIAERGLALREAERAEQRAELERLLQNVEGREQSNHHDQ